MAVSLLSGAEIFKVVNKLLGGSALGVDEICLEFLRALDVVMADTTVQHCVDIGCCATGLADQGDGPPFKKENQKVCSNSLVSELGQHCSNSN